MLRFLLIFISLILALGAVCAKDGDGAPPAKDESQTIFTYATSGNLEKVKELVDKDPKALQQADDRGRNVLAVAVSSGQVAITIFLLDKGMDIKMLSATNMLPPTELCTLLHLAAGSGKPEMVEFLLGKGLDINAATNKFKVTPLFLACWNSKPEVVEFLLTHGANPNAALAVPPQAFGIEAKDAEKLPGFGTPLMFIAMDGNAEIEALLRKHGATALAPEIEKPIKERREKERLQEQRQKDCMANLTKLGEAVLQYAKAHEGRLPAAETVWEQIIPAPNPRACPAKDAQNGYGYNVELSDKLLASVKNPQEVVLFADANSEDHLIVCLDDIDQHRHEYGYIIVFLDGHTEFMRPGKRVKLK